MAGDLRQLSFEFPQGIKEEKENNHPLSEWGRKQTAMCLTESSAYIIPQGGAGGKKTTHTNINMKRGDSMTKSDFRNMQETETEKERVVKYDSYVDGKIRAHITVRIPKRTPEEQAAYEKRLGDGLVNFYHAIIAQGLDWDKVTAEK